MLIKREDMRPMKSRLWFLAVLVSVVFLFWWLVYPHALSYQEQNQLFLWTDDYFCERLSLPSGLACYLGEFVTQFCLIPWLGALLLAGIFAVVYGLTRSEKDTTAGNLLPLVPVILLLWHLGDENVLFSYPVAVAAALLAARLMAKLTVWADVVVIPLLYWCIGPMAWLYIGIRIMRLGWNGTWLLVYMAAILLVMSAILPLPVKSVLWGISYYRIPTMVPVLQFVIPCVIILTMAAEQGCGGFLNKRFTLAGLTGTLAVLAYMAVNKGFDADKYELIRQDYLIRNERWTDIINRAEKKEVKTPLWSQSVNLALAMKRQLAERQFDFYQSGPDALFMPSVHDNTSGWPSAEAFWRLGMVNTAQRYYTETQMAILNHRLSGRAMKRLAECAIVNGQYAVAEKYLNVLKHTLFYRTWAERTSKCLYHDEVVMAHPVYAKKRNLRYNSDFFFSSAIMDQMLAILFASHQDNTMALDYTMAQVLLNGNGQMFLELMPWVQRYGRYARLPREYENAVQVLQGHDNGSGYGLYMKSNRMNKTE